MKLSHAIAALSFLALPGLVAAACEDDLHAIVAADAITVDGPGGTVVLVEFEAGSPALTRNGQLQVRELAALLHDQPDLRLTLEVAPTASGRLAAARESALARELQQLDAGKRQFEIRRGTAASYAAFEQSGS